MKIDFAKFEFGKYLDMIDNGETKWDQVEPMIEAFAPMLDAMFHLNPTHPAVTAAVGSLPVKPGANFSVMHVLELIKKGDVKYEQFMPFLHHLSDLFDQIVAVLQPAHPAVAAVIAKMPAK